MVYRKADLTDVKDLAVLRKAQLRDEGALPSRDIDAELVEYFRRALTDGSFISWIALEGENIIATSGVCFYGLPPTFANPSGTVAYVTNMYTVPEYRRRGIATRLFEKVLQEARARECRIARLHASTEGRLLYVKYGFTDSEGYMALMLG